MSRLRLTPSGLLVLAGWVIGVVIVAITVRWVPWHMDEFVMFHRLGCAAPSQQLDPGPLGCSGFPSEFLGFEFHRSYSYIGAMSSLLLWPFWVLWPSLNVVWVYGALMLLGISIGLVRSFRIPARSAFFVLLFFPLMFSVMHDGGPVRLSLLVVSWSPWIVQRVLRAPRLYGVVGWGALLVVGVVAAVEDKPFFAYLLPGLVVFSLAAMPRWEIPRAWPNLRRAVVLWGAVALAVFLELMLIRVDGMSYLAYLGAERPPLADRPIQAVSDLIRWSYDWPMWAHRVIEYPSPSIPMAGVVALALIMPVLLFGLWWFAGWSLWRRRKEDAWTGVALVAALIAFAAAAIWSGGWTSHHYVFVYVPLAVALLLAWERSRPGIQTLVVAALAFSSLLTLAVIRVSPLLPTSSPYIDEAVEGAISLADPNDVVACGSFGCGWQDILLNRRDIPVFMTHWNEGPNNDALEAATERGGSVIHVCADCDATTVQSRYPGASIEDILDTSSGWHAFRLTPEAEGSVQSPS